MTRITADPSAVQSPRTLIRTRIGGIGGDGDGVGRLSDGRPLYLPYTLPDELVEARAELRRGGGMAGVAEAILEPSAERVSPPCPHFGVCGGCTLQHWGRAALDRWKSAELAAALAAAGYPDAPLQPLVPSGPGTRRRVDLAIRKQGGVVLGFHRHRAADVVPIEACLVAAPTIVALLEPLRGVIQRLQAIRREASCAINILDTGPDLLFRTDGELAASDRRLLAAFATAHGIPRIAWARGDGDIELAAQLGPVAVTLAGVVVAPPPGAFLQATAEGAAAITAAVLAALPAGLRPRDRVVELHSGCGTLTFAIARHARVTAYEGDAGAVAALTRAAGQAGLHGTVLAQLRDLNRQPLGEPELRDAAAIVLDPPFGGALTQTEAIAASAATRVIYVSCSPAALARDAAVLQGAGFALASAAPIDQFLWSSRLESVCVFTRPPRPRRAFRSPR
ncbi:MAG: class I SAM-dependent RNA methyltransferase [Proteobacteria bacterium]|nr:class I SAM-dependent RNA methyltransferase [Pseudomonadota bacterium]